MPEPKHRHRLVPFFVSLFLFTNSALSLPIKAGLSIAPAPGDGRENGGCRSCHSINRPDPLHRLKYYHGGFDIRNKHYWASAAFTGVHGYVVAGLWLLCGAGFGLLLAVKKSRINPGPTTASSNLWPLVTFSLIILFTLLAITASGVVLSVNRSLLYRTDQLKESIVGIGKDARSTIRKITQAIRQMEDLLQPFDLRTAVELNITSHKLGRESRAIQQFIGKTDHSIGLAINTSYILHLVVVLVNLLMLIAATVLILLHWQHWFIGIIIVCWIITTLFWVITGFDFFFHSFGEDTCSAFRDYVQNPHNSSLSSTLPCVSTSYANQVLVQIGSTVYDFIQQLNLKIAAVGKIFTSSKQTESLGGTFRVCQPFSGPPDYDFNGNCSKGEIPVAEVPQVLTTLTCFRNENPAECAREGKFLPEGAYNITWAVTTSIEDLLDIYPDLQNLSQCSFVKERLGYIVSRQCRPFKSSIRTLWASMLCLSIFMVVLVLLWVIKAYQDKGRSFSLCSIFPNPLDTGEPLHTREIATRVLHIS